MPLAALSQTPKSDSLLHALEKFPPFGGTEGGADTTKIKLLNSLAWQLKYSNPDTSIILSTQALKIANKEKYQTGIGQSCHNLGSFHLLKGSYDTALTFYNNALEIWKQLEKYKSGIRNRLSATLGNIGLIYWNKGDYPTALDHYRQALEIDKKLGNKNETLSSSEISA